MPPVFIVPEAFAKASDNPVSAGRMIVIL